MLILEGADLVGKTTMMEQMREALARRDLPHETRHLSRLAPAFDHFRDYLQLMRPDVIWDRLHLSELAYRSHDGYPSSITPAKFRLVEAGAVAAAGFTIILVADPDTISDRYQTQIAAGRAEMYDLDHVLRVNQTYREMADFRNVMVREESYDFRVDVVLDTSGFDALAEVINDVADQYAERYREWRLLTGGIVG